MKKHRPMFDSCRRVGAMVSPLLIVAGTILTLTPSYAVEFPPSGGRGAPARTAGGGMRGDSCSAAEQGNLTVLTPPNNTNTFVGDEVKLLFYVPEVTNRTAEIYVEDPETFDVVYEASFPLDNTPGIVAVSFPAVNQTTGEALVTGVDYPWEFAIVCNPSDRAIDLAVSGLIQPMELSTAVAEELETLALPNDVPSLQSAEVHANAGIWQETVTQLAALRCSSESNWVELLTSVDLEELTETSLNHCTASGTASGTASE